MNSRWYTCSELPWLLYTSSCLLMLDFSTRWWSTFKILCTFHAYKRLCWYQRGFLKKTWWRFELKRHPICRFKTFQSMVYILVYCSDPDPPVFLVKRQDPQIRGFEDACKNSEKQNMKFSMRILKLFSPIRLEEIFILILLLNIFQCFRYSSMAEQKFFYFNNLNHNFIQV